MLNPFINCRECHLLEVLIRPFPFGLTFLTMKWSHVASTNSLQFHLTRIALGWTYLTLRHAEELSRVAALVLPKLIDLLRDSRGRFVFFQWEVTLVKMIKNARHCQTLPRNSKMVMVYLATLFVPSSTASEPWMCSTLSERPWSLFKSPKQVQLSMSTLTVGCEINSDKKHVLTDICRESCLRLRRARPLEVLRSFCSLSTSVMAETKTSSWPELHWESFSWLGFDWPSDSVSSSQLCDLTCFICLIECKTNHWVPGCQRFFGNFGTCSCIFRNKWRQGPGDVKRVRSFHVAAL